MFMKNLDFTIDKNIPVPPTRGKWCRIFSEMNNGDSILMRSSDARKFQDYCRDKMKSKTTIREWPYTNEEISQGATGGRHRVWMIYKNTTEVTQGIHDKILLADYNLSVRVRNCFRENRIYTIGELRKLTKVDLLKMNNFGAVALREVLSFLKGLGLPELERGKW
jgi:hypothetical protein